MNKLPHFKKFNWQKQHFDHIDVHAPKLAYYSSNAKLAELIITRLFERAHKFSSNGKNKSKFKKIAKMIESSEAYKIITKEMKTVSVNSKNPSTLSQNNHSELSESEQPGLEEITTRKQLLEYSKK